MPLPHITLRAMPLHELQAHLKAVEREVHGSATTTDAPTPRVRYLELVRKIWWDRFRAGEGI